MFLTHRKKIDNLWFRDSKNENDFRKIGNFNDIHNKKSFYRKLNIIDINTTPTYYDLYKFLGTTYSTGTSSPSPASAYEATLISGSTYEYRFKYPTIAFPTLSGTTPESITDGATPWEFQVSIAIVKTSITFEKMPDWGINGSKIISYLENEDGSPVSDIKVILREEGTNTDEISIDFNEFYRWIKLSVGYRLEYHAIYPLSGSSQIFLTSKIYIYNSRHNYYG